MEQLRLAYRAKVLTILATTEAEDIADAISLFAVDTFLNGMNAMAISTEVTEGRMTLAEASEAVKFSGPNNKLVN
jgi:alkylation response protein AidB-like acyl-CoA dehydrogenase